MSANSAAVNIPNGATNSCVGRVHGAVEALNRGYRECGVSLPGTRMVGELGTKEDFAGALVVAPPSAQSSPWMKRFGDYSDAFASGWMAIRGARRRRAVDQGFVLSDHADWPSLNRAIEATGAQVPPPLQRMRADDLLAAVFPDQVACGENLSGPIRIPDHPLVKGVESFEAADELYLSDLHGERHVLLETEFEGEAGAEEAGA